MIDQEGFTQVLLCMVPGSRELNGEWKQMLLELHYGDSAAHFWQVASRTKSK